MRRCSSEELLLRFAESELEEPEASLLREHTLTCEKCRDLLEQYSKALLLLATEKIGEPSPADWERVMARVREKLHPQSQGWPLWVKGAALTAAAAGLLLILWHTGIEMRRKPGGTPHIAQPSEQEISPHEKGMGDRAVAQHEERAAGKEDRVTEELEIPEKEDLFEGTDALVTGRGLVASDTTSFSLAGLDDEELSGLNELVMDASILWDSDFLLSDLTEEEETELVKELESLPSI